MQYFFSKKLIVDSTLQSVLAQSVGTDVEAFSGFGWEATAPA